MFINRPSEDGVGLFGYFGSGYVANLRLVDVNVTGSEGVGALGGNVWGASPGLSNIDITGNISGGSDVGGLVGYFIDTDVRDCHFHGPAVRGAWKVGGLAGVLGRGSMTDCHTEGTVTGNDEVGGLVGFPNGGTVRASFATADVAGSTKVGGLFGSMYYSSTVTDSYANGSVTGTSRYAGGLVGYSSNEGLVTRSYAAGGVTGVSDVGGLVGYKTFNVGVTDSFYDTQTTGQTGSAGGTGNTTSEMRTRNTFTDAGWDFETVWFIIENVTYPILRWQDARPPTADAGPDQTVDEGDLVTFDGTGSSDDFAIAGYTWTFTDGGPVTLRDARPSHRFDAPGTFLVTLNVTDTAGKSGTDQMTVTVNDTTSPVADAGSDKTVDRGDLVTFDGSGSLDNVGITNYTWTFSVGTNITLHGVRPSQWFDIPGTYVVTLNVTDAAGNWDTDDMTVTVNDIDTPTARAGPDQTVDEGTLVTFDGSGSLDNVGVVNYTWTLSDGALVTLHGANATHQFDDPGVFVVTLNVTDAAGNWDTDTLTVTVNDITPPVADAGPDLVVDEDAVVTLDGSASSDNVGLINYVWTFTGDGLVLLYDVHPTYMFATPGIYVVTLNVTDATGYWATDTVTVTVRDVTPPVIVFEPPVQEALKGSEILLAPEVSDNVGVAGAYIVYRYGDGAIANETVEGEVTLSIPRHPGGNLHLRFAAVDAAGNWHTTPEFTIALVNVPPAVVDLTAWEVIEGVDAELDLGPHVVDPNDDDFNISCDDDRVQVDGLVLRVRHDVAIPDRTVNLTVSDGDDSAIVSLTIHVVNVNDLPVITALLPANGTEYKKGKAIAFSVNATDEDGDELTITWNEGDVVLGTGSQFEYSKLGKGEHTITVVVDDGTGTVEDSLVVVVKQDKKSPGAGPMVILLSLILATLIAATRRHP